ncbi:phosphoesterase PA-phosphatase related [Chthoniobacter flavus Ellin428]|uniref:Phosphoesterase PA-phosphatase related n=1 Tax=Chthoniobacter flavus Ellin428 TaxID=497964 RepID=B4D375_9BACT|nr:phosphatase PAP2 family protein [Chthoniobacter flavus]EDY19186.1 phosphoesterase PA-phosphatase related [Chthoniobacter flavus Ellin428]TCO88032.1 PAP2 superfamily protein [Chthoniobacter flavus]
MNRLRTLRLLPHEWFFGAFLLITSLRLIAAVGPLDPAALLYPGLLLLNAALIVWSEVRQTQARWFARLWAYPVMINVVFMTMGSTALKLVSHPQDTILQQLDGMLVGVTPSLRAESLITPWLTETFSFCYLLFFPYLFFSWVFYTWKGLPAFRRLCTGLFTIYAVGFLGYSTVPAAGPHLAMTNQFSVPLTGWVFTRINDYIVAHGSNGVDAFPSLHCAVSSYLLFFDRRHAPWRFRLYAVPCAGLWLATIYLRYHYFVDIVAGFALASFALWLSRRWEKSLGETSPESATTQPRPSHHASHLALR